MLKILYFSDQGTTYKRVIPQQEINSNERDKFWQKEEEEEKKRQEAERKRREEEKKKLENEIKQREIEEAAQREARIKERSKSISVLREAERNELMRVNAANLAERGNDIEDREKEEMERKERSEILRRQRSQEAQALISKRTIDARAVFEQNTSAGQLHHRRASYQPTTNTSVNFPLTAASGRSVTVSDSRRCSERKHLLVQERKSCVPCWSSRLMLVRALNVLVRTRKLRGSV
ncbi:hypothetical protein J6590_017827 [Homalodisca vitripennis]|nr:hypothetical protein J6590_017827 [Homalodisca vitripennis]